MSDHVLERFQVNGYTVEILPDEDCSNPHEDDVHFLLLKFEGRRDGMGDEVFNREQWDVVCDACGGCGCQGGCIDEAKPTDDCEKCGGSGNLYIETTADAMKAAAVRYAAIAVAPVTHWSQSSSIYRLTTEDDEHAWGLILYTKAMAEMWGGDPTEADILEQMKNDLEEYSDWASGYCQGFRILDLLGDEVDACWGFIGTDDKGSYWAATEGRSVAESLPSPDDQRLAWAKELV